MLVAQLVEQRTFNPWVLGSSPSEHTKQKPPVKAGGFSFIGKSKNRKFLDIKFDTSVNALGLIISSRPNCLLQIRKAVNPMKLSKSILVSLLACTVLVIAFKKWCLIPLEILSDVAVAEVEYDPEYETWSVEGKGNIVVGEVHYYKFSVNSIEYSGKSGIYKEFNDRLQIEYLKSDPSFNGFHLFNKVSGDFFCYILAFIVFVIFAFISINKYRHKPINYTLKISDYPRDKATSTT